MIVAEIRTDKNYRKYKKHLCLGCGKERWVQVIGEKFVSQRCRSCAAKKFTPIRKYDNHPGWKGGRTKSVWGYFLVKLAKDDFFYSMAWKTGYVSEHRLVMAKHLGRNLHTWELVHHRNGNKSDNRIENLELISDDRHKQIIALQQRIKRLEAEIALLKGGEQSL